MTRERAKKVFAQYNPAADVQRCPRGKAALRKRLDDYARAAVNLYGLIRREELADIFNQQNSEQVTAQELYLLLLPLVLKEGCYGFYKDYLVHRGYFNDFDIVSVTLEKQGDKERYIPEREEFLRFADEEYTDNVYVPQLRQKIHEFFGLGGITYQGFAELCHYLLYHDAVDELGAILDHYDLVFSSEEKAEEFMRFVANLKNNQRRWQNKGFTPDEYQELQKSLAEPDQEPLVAIPRKVGRNDPCPCGSGKKYKKCCAAFDDVKSAQLSPEEVLDFYEIWYGLLAFVNERRQINKEKIPLVYPHAVDPRWIAKVRDVLWEEPALIDEYLAATELPEETRAVLKLWRSKHKNGMFFVVRYELEYAVFLAPDEDEKAFLYGVKGISDSVAKTLGRDLPTQIETVLLPFKGKIVYDSLFKLRPVSFGKGIKEVFQTAYEDTLVKGIITSLE